MGDDKQYTIQVKGTAYKFKAVSAESFERIALVQSMTRDQTKVIRAISTALETAAVGDSWDKITDRWVAGELSTAESTIRILETLIKRQSTSAKKAKDGDAPTADDAE